MLAVCSSNGLKKKGPSRGTRDRPSLMLLDSSFQQGEIEMGPLPKNFLHFPWNFTAPFSSEPFPFAVPVTEQPWPAWPLNLKPFGFTEPVRGPNAKEVSGHSKS